MGIESDESPDCIEEDLYITQRRRISILGDDLYLDKSIFFVEAITNFVIKNLPGKYMNITYQDTINPANVLCLPLQGMPVNAEESSHEYFS